MTGGGAGGAAAAAGPAKTAPGEVSTGAAAVAAAAGATAAAAACRSFLNLPYTLGKPAAAVGADGTRGKTEVAAVAVTSSHQVPAAVATS